MAIVMAMAMATDRTYLASVCGRFGVVLGSSWGRLGVVLGRLGVVFGSF